MSRRQRRRMSSTPAGSNSANTCPECGRRFSRAQALGAHRRQAHGIAGTSRRTQARQQADGRAASGGDTGKSARRRSANGVDHDRLLQTLFPDGIPAREDIIGALNSWLAEADRIARLRG
jgi:C2H2-type zinc finger